MTEAYPENLNATVGKPAKPKLLQEIEAWIDYFLGQWKCVLIAFVL